MNTLKTKSLLGYVKTYINCICSYWADNKSLWNSRRLSINLNKNQRSFWETVKRFFFPFQVEPRLYTRALIVRFIIACYGVYVVLVVKNITKLIEDKNFHQIKINLIIFFFVSICNYLISYFSRYIRNTIPTHDTIKIINRKYMVDFFKLDSSEVEKMWTWKILSIMNRSMDIRREFMRDGLWSISELTVLIWFSFWMIFDLAWAYWLFFLLLFIVLFTIVSALNKKALIFRKKKKEANISYQRQLIKMIMSKNEILQNNKILQEMSVLDGFVDEEKWRWGKVITYWNLVYMSPNILVFLIRFFVLAYLSYLFYLWNVSFSIFASLIALVWYLEWSMWRAIDFYANFTDKFVEVEKLFDLFDTVPKMKNFDTWKEFKFKTGDIQIKKICFWYSENNLLFDNFSLSIKWWEKTAFVGASGSGKTTLIKLIAWYLYASNWEISIDWQKISDLKLQSYYYHIGYLTQEPSVFDGTLYENLLYATDKTPSEEELNNAVKNAQCEFIYDFEQWLQTEIWERWIRLSWWQKQRLAIAKIFLKNPEIILLDEPTSALDSFAEEEVKKAFDNLFKWRTVIVIAHRLQTVKTADIIYVIDKWKVIEQWNHHELIKLGCHYKKMLDLQSWF